MGDERAPWETGGDLPWETDGDDWRGDVEEGHEAWRGEVHFADWPEDGAGPEYWMYKNLKERP